MGLRMIAAYNLKFSTVLIRNPAYCHRAKRGKGIRFQFLFLLLAILLAYQDTT